MCVGSNVAGWVWDVFGWRSIVFHGCAGLDALLFSWALVLGIWFPVHSAGIFATVLRFVNGVLEGRLDWSVDGGHQFRLVRENIVVFAEQVSCGGVESRVWVGVDEKTRDCLHISH
jgi:hypothetical protein